MTTTTIPDTDKVYKRVHYNESITNKITGEVEGILPISFDPKAKRGQPIEEAGTSVDWEKYSTAEESQKRAKKPELNSIVSLNVGKVRNIKIKKLDVIYCPQFEDSEENLAHSEIRFLPPRKPKNKEMGVRAKLIDIAEWEIKVDKSDFP